MFFFKFDDNIILIIFTSLGREKKEITFQVNATIIGFVGCFPVFNRKL